jgi:shikimate kinase
VADRAAPIVFVGLMATGKTTVAEAVAECTGWPVRDSDADIEAATGRTVAELLEEEGAEALHEREAAHLLDVVVSGQRCLLAAAASTIDDDRCVVALRSVPVVWLRASLETMVDRFDSRSGRPAFGQSPAQLLAGQLAARTSRFADVADLVLDVDDREPAGLAEEIVAHLGLGRDAAGGGGPQPDR